MVLALAVLSGVFGLIGVLVGGLITYKIESQKADDLRERERADRQRQVAIDLQDLLESIETALLEVVSYRNAGHNMDEHQAVARGAFIASARISTLATRLDDQALAEACRAWDSRVLDVIAAEYDGTSTQAGMDWIDPYQLQRRALAEALAVTLRA